MLPEDQRYAPPEMEETLTTTNGERDSSEVVIGIHGDDPLTDSPQYMNVSHKQLRRGLVVTGSEGYGKTTLFENILLQLAEDGHGFCYIDMKGDGSKSILQKLPSDRLDDVVFVGSHGRDHDYNPFELLEVPAGGMLDPDVISCMFDYVGPKTEMLSKIGGTTANTEGKSIFELEDVFEKLGSEITPMDIAYKYDLHSVEPHDPEIAPLLKRINDLRENIPEATEIFDPSGVSIYDAIRNEKILIANFSSIASLDSNKIANAFFAKLNEVVAKTTRKEKMYPVVCEAFDEMNPPNSMVEDYTSEMRSLNVPLFAGVTHLKQMYYEDQNAVFDNIDNFMAFNSGGIQDANEASSLVDIDNRDDLLDLPRYKVAVRMRNPKKEQKAWITTLLPVEPRRECSEILGD